MARKKASETNVEVGNIRDVSGEVSIAGGDIYKGFTAEQVSILIQQITTEFEPKKFDGRSPYKGLDVFDEDDADLFFGREKIVNDLVSRVKESRTVFITGPSGSGKSSLIRAGLIPALKAGAIKNSYLWLYATIKPGRDPFEALKSAFSRLKSPELGNYFIQNITKSDVLHECTETSLTERKDQRLVLFIDQFEEVFTQINKEEERVRFLNLLTYAATIENGRLIILFSIRSDFVSNCATYPKLNSLLNQQFVQIGALQPHELVSAIAQPALQVGLKIEPNLIAQIINDMKGEPGALPLMQFVLKDLFDAGQAQGGTSVLTLKDYLERGGIHKALERHADDSFAKLDQREQELARTIFSRLIEIGRGTEDTKRMAYFDELVPANTRSEEVQVTLQKLQDARLITTEDNTNKYTIIHEKLIDAWPWLKKTVSENRDMITIQNEVAEDAQEWKKHKRDKSYLYSGARLATITEQLKWNRLLFADISIEFIKVAQNRQRQNKNIVVGSISTIIGLLILTAIVFGNQAKTNAELAKRNAEIAIIAIARQLAAQAQAINSEGKSNQSLAELLAIQSMKMMPSIEAEKALQNNYAAKLLLNIPVPSEIIDVVVSPDGKHFATGYGNVVEVREAFSGKQIALMHHDDYVTVVAFSPDGKYVVSGSWDHTMRIWETAGGKEISRISHNDVVTSLDISSNGKFVVSGSKDGTIGIWDVPSGVLITRITVGSPVYSVAFSPDQQSVLSVSSDGFAKLWSIATKKLIFSTPLGSNFGMKAFTSDGNNVVLGGCEKMDDKKNCINGIVQIFTPSTEKMIMKMNHDDYVTMATYSPNDMYIASASYDQTARIWDAKTGKEISRMTFDALVSTVVFSSDSKYAAAGSFDGTVRVWDILTGREIARTSHDDESVTSVAFSPDNTFMVSGSYKSIHVWSFLTNKQIIRAYQYGSVQSINFSPNGKYIATGGDDNTARVWSNETGQEISQIKHDDLVSNVVFSPDNKYVVSSGWDKTARMWDITTSKVISRMNFDDFVASDVFSPDGKYVISASRDKTAKIWEAQTGNEISRIKLGTAITSIAFISEGRDILVGHDDGTIVILDWLTGQEIKHFFFPEHTTAVVSPNSEYLAVTLSQNTQVVNTASGENVALIRFGHEVNRVLFSPDSKLLAIGGFYSSEIIIWDLRAGQTLKQINLNGDLNSLVFSPDSKFILTGSSHQGKRDGMAQIWNVSTGKEVSRMDFNNFVPSVAFSLDGKYAAAGGGDNQFIRWIWSPSEIIIDGCSRVTRNLSLAEWQQYVGDALPYQAVCDNLPIEPEVTVTPVTTP